MGATTLRVGPMLGMKLNSPASTALARLRGTPKIQRPMPLSSITKLLVNRIPTSHPRSASSQRLRM